jgi:hypothetical protein
MARAWLALAAATLAALVAAAPADALTRDRAEQVAMRELDPQRSKTPVVLFGLREPVEKGALVFEGGAGPGSRRRTRSVRRKGYRGTVTRIAEKPLRGDAWLFWLDRMPRGEFQHPSVLLLVDDRTGRVVRERNMTWYPLVDGKRPAFLRTRLGYDGSAYRVFSSERPFQAGRSSSSTVLGRVSLTPPPKLAGNCIVTIGDRVDPIFKGDFAAIHQIARTLKLDKRDADTVAELERHVEQLVKGGCKDVVIWVAAHGYPALGSNYKDPQKGFAIPESQFAQVGLAAEVGKDSSGNPIVSRETLDSQQVRTLMEKYSRRATFKLVVQACFSGRWAEIAATENLRVIGTSNRRDQVGYAYFPNATNWQVMTQKNAVMTDTGETRAFEAPNPTKASPFVNHITQGLLRWASSEQSYTRTGDDLAKGIAEAFTLGASADAAAFLGWTNPQLVNNTSRGLPPPPPIDFTALVQGGYRHLGPGSSEVCGTVATVPVQAGARYELEIMGPGVVGQGGRAGTLDANGEAREAVPINKFGVYTVLVTVTAADGTVRQAITTVEVVGGPDKPCP